MNRFKSEDGKQALYASYDRLLTMWNIDMDEVDLPSTYGTTHVILVGQWENPPLLLFHGVGDNSAIMWVYNIHELAKHFFVVAVDTMGGPGKSEPNDTYMRSFDKIQWIDEILLQLRISKTYVAGVSNGAHLASCYIANRPDKVYKAVCMAGGVKVSLTKMMFLFLPEALFPSEKNTLKLLKKLTAPGISVFEQNRELLVHWTILLKQFNNRSMMAHKNKKFTLEDMQQLKKKAIYLNW